MIHDVEQHIVLIGWLQCSAQRMPNFNRPHLPFKMSLRDVNDVS